MSHNTRTTSKPWGTPPEFTIDDFKVSINYKQRVKKQQALSSLIKASCWKPLLNDSLSEIQHGQRNFHYIIIWKCLIQHLLMN